MNTINFLQSSFRAVSLRDTAAKIFVAPWQLLLGAADAASDRREAARVRAASAALDPRLLRDVGLHRSLVDRSELYRFPCH